MRIVTGTISHETNVLSNIETDLVQFRKRRLLYGEEVFDYFRGTKTPVGGLMDGCERQGFEIIPTVYASATPAGTLTAEAFDTLLNDILEGIRKAGRSTVSSSTSTGPGSARTTTTSRGTSSPRSGRSSGTSPWSPPSTSTPTTPG